MINQMQALPPFRSPFSQTSFAEHRVNADLSSFPLDLIKSQFEAHTLSEGVSYLSPPMSRSPPPPDSSKAPLSIESAQLGFPGQPRRVRSNPSIGSYIATAEPPRLDTWRRQDLWQSGEVLGSNRPGEPHPVQGVLEEAPRTVQGRHGDSSSPNIHRTPFASQPSLPSPRSARRAKAHVPSACVNCKRKHLRCEQRRPCHRCVQAGKEVTSAIRKLPMRAANRSRAEFMRRRRTQEERPTTASGRTGSKGRRPSNRASAVVDVNGTFLWISRPLSRT